MCHGPKSDVSGTSLPSDFSSAKIQHDGERHLGNWFSGNLLVSMAYICMKFCTGTKHDIPQSNSPSKVTSYKIQDGGGRHFDIRLNDFNTVTIADTRSYRIRLWDRALYTMSWKQLYQKKLVDFLVKQQILYIKMQAIYLMSYKRQI